MCGITSALLSSRARLYRVVAFSALILGALVIVGVSGRLATARAISGLDPPGRIENVGGRSVHVHCLGPEDPSSASMPTVWLEPGNASFSLDWAGVQRELAALTRTCTYDRAGFGWSDPTASPRDAETMTQELRALRELVGIDDSEAAVLVGHSLGALNALLHAANHRETVAGLVLVDPAEPDLVQSRAYGEVKAATARYYHAMRLFAASGMMPWIGPVVEAVGGDRVLPETARRLPELRDEYLTLTSSPIFWETALRELDQIESSARQVEAALEAPSSPGGAAGSPPLGDLPLVVLSAGRPEGTPPELFDSQRAGHAELSDLSTRGELRILSRSGHRVHFDAPRAIVESARDVLDVPDVPDVPASVDPRREDR